MILSICYKDKNAKFETHCSGDNTDQTGGQYPIFGTRFGCLTTFIETKTIAS